MYFVMFAPNFERHQVTLEQISSLLSISIAQSKVLAFFVVPATGIVSTLLSALNF